MPMPRQVSAQRVQEATWTLNGLPSAEGREMAGSARDVGMTVGIAAEVWNKPEAPAVTAGAS